MDDLVNTAVCAGEPVVDRSEVAQDTTGDSRLFRNLTDGRFFRRFVALKVTLRQAPFKAATTIPTSDDHGIGVAVLYGNNDATSTCLINNRQRMAPSSRLMGGRGTPPGLMPAKRRRQGSFSRHTSHCSNYVPSHVLKRVRTWHP